MKLLRISHRSSEVGCPGHGQLRASPLPRDDRNHGTIVAILSSLTVATSQKSQTKVAICGLVFYGNIMQYFRIP